eukprot:CAMPEP_0119165040 /NCGR_PEP_ID=MMETSP1315-20130426/4776_1 /TAXON_ID=676789 /ORGANISM="Prasinoderma singularis, Strain RCC927" /LENGTH=152 /DNA_ID=CAMNT_0007158279 /DNA_START=240 /DNA_END=695 /DNA_ORIENTATION=-
MGWEGKFESWPVEGGWEVESMRFFATSPQPKYIAWNIGTGEGDLAPHSHLAEILMDEDCFKGLYGVIFVVDCLDRARIDEARDALHRLLADERVPKEAPLLVLANKVDAGQAAMPPDVVKEKLQLASLGRAHVHVQSTNARAGVGLGEAIRW